MATDRADRYSTSRERQRPEKSVRVPIVENPNIALERLVERWCDRREYAVLSLVLPAYCSNNGLTDGWTDLRDALRTAYGSARDRLPSEERDEIKRIYVQIDIALRER